MTTPRCALTWLLAFSLGFAGTMQGAQAAMIGTDEAAASAALAPGSTPALAGSAQARLAGLLQRDDVVAALRERGVSADEARARVAALSDREAAFLAEQIDTAPAGGTDLLGAAVFIFVLLLVTDILGFTKIFPFTRSVR